MEGGPKRGDDTGRRNGTGMALPVAPRTTSKSSFSDYSDSDGNNRKARRPNRLPSVHTCCGVMTTVFPVSESVIGSLS